MASCLAAILYRSSIWATQSKNDPLGEKFQKQFSLKFVREPVNYNSVLKKLVSDAYKAGKSHHTHIWLFKTFSMVMFYLHCTHALQLRQIRVDFINQVHFQILDSALER